MSDYYPLAIWCRPPDWPYEGQIPQPQTIHTEVNANAPSSVNPENEFSHLRSVYFSRVPITMRPSYNQEIWIPNRGQSTRQHLSFSDPSKRPTNIPTIEFVDWMYLKPQTVKTSESLPQSQLKNLILLPRFNVKQASNDLREFLCVPWSLISRTQYLTASQQDNSYNSITL